MGMIQGDFKRVIEKIYPCEDGIAALQQGQKDQEKFSHVIFKRMQEMEAKADVQEERIVLLEEELATLWWKNACTCGEEKKEEATVTSGSGSQEEPFELEYADREEGSNLDSSYHLPMVAQDEPLLIFGSPAIEEVPILLLSFCACLVPAIVYIRDGIEIAVVPRENESLVSVQVERLPRCTVDIQHLSHGQPVAHYKSSKCHLNHHAKQLGVCPPSHLGYFMGQDLQFASAREFYACVLASGGRTDLGSSGAAEQSPRSSEDPGVVADVGLNTAELGSFSRKLDSFWFTLVTE